tara:strand:- start:29 stop:388 length:360 start_codon:yes stop_codon:yes gene_type:complete
MQLQFDFDNISRQKSIKNLKKARDLLQGFHPNVRFQLNLRESGGKKGYHGRIRGNGNEEMHPGIEFIIRQVSGDDGLRIEIDRKRKKNGISYDILFDSYQRSDGIVHHAGKWEVISKQT